MNKEKTSNNIISEILSLNSDRSSFIYEEQALEKRIAECTTSRGNYLAKIKEIDEKTQQLKLELIDIIQAEVGGHILAEHELSKINKKIIKRRKKKI